MLVKEILSPKKMVQAHHYLSDEYIEVAASEMNFNQGMTIDIVPGKRYHVVVTGTYDTAEVEER